MRRWYKIPLKAVLLFAFSAILWGCGDDEAERAEQELKSHEALMAQLEPKRAERKEIAAERAKVVKEMEALIAKAKAALVAAGKANPTSAELKAELEGKPEVYPHWKEFHAKVEELNAQRMAKLKEAEDLVREKLKRDGVKPSK